MFVSIREQSSEDFIQVTSYAVVVVLARCSFCGRIVWKGEVIPISTVVGEGSFKHTWNLRGAVGRREYLRKADGSLVGTPFSVIQKSLGRPHRYEPNRRCAFLYLIDSTSARDGGAGQSVRRFAVQRRITPGRPIPMLDFSFQGTQACGFSLNCGPTSNWYRSPVITLI
jgi:hypothetical protein